MRDIVLLTKNGFRYEDMHDIILNAFLGFEAKVDDPCEGYGRIWVAKGQQKIDIDFTPDDVMSAFQEEFEEDQLDVLPFDAHLTNVNFRVSKAIIQLINALINAGIEFWVLDEDGKIVSPDAFVPLPDAAPQPK